VAVGGDDRASARTGDARHIRRRARSHRWSLHAWRRRGRRRGSRSIGTDRQPSPDARGDTTWRSRVRSCR